MLVRAQTTLVVVRNLMDFEVYLADGTKLAARAERRVEFTEEQLKTQRISAATLLVAATNPVEPMMTAVETVQTELTNLKASIVATDAPSNTRVASMITARLPDLTNYALKSDIPSPAAPTDLTPYALKTDIPSMPVAPDLTPYALKTELPTVPAPPDLSGYARKSELPATPDLSGYARKTELPAPVDLSPYAKKSDLPTVPALPDLSPYALKTQIPVVPPAPDLSGYALRSELPVVPTAPDLTPYAKKSELPNLAPYALKTELPSLSGYALKSELPSLTGLTSRVSALEKSSFLIINGVVLAFTANLTIAVGRVERTVAVVDLKTTDGFIVNATAALPAGLIVSDWQCRSDGVLTAVFHNPALLTISAATSVPLVITRFRQTS